MQNLNLKKLAALGAVLAAILAAVLGFLFTLSSQKDLEIKNPEVIPTLNPQSTSRLTTFDNGTVAFEYPETATFKTAPISGGGDSISIYPKTSTNPVIEIQITQASETPIERMHGIFSAYGFQRQEVLIGGRNAIYATLYKGSIPLANSPLQEEVVIFKKNKKVFKIQMSYLSSSVDSEASEAFQAVISTFKP